MREQQVADLENSIADRPSHQKKNQKSHTTVCPGVRVRAAEAVPSRAEAEEEEKKQRHFAAAAEERRASPSARRMPEPVEGPQARP